MASSDSSDAAAAASRKFDVDIEVFTMESMSIGQLRKRFTEVCGESTNSRHRLWLIKRIAWRMQANLEGGLSERALARAAELANGADIRVTAPRKPKITETDPERTKLVPCSIPSDDRTPVPGSLLRREYMGRHIFVRVLHEGFEWEGKVYSSLTAIAKAVTGSHWNGYHFFGLRKKEARA